MKLSVLLFSIFIFHILGTTSSWADPGDLSCRGALNQLAKAQEIVQAKEREVQQAKSTTKIAFVEIEVCRPGMPVNSRTIRNCVKHREEVPRKVRNLIEVESELGDAIQDFQIEFDQMSDACLSSHSYHSKTRDSLYP